jgi:bifunctional non-homologous end joining protein LigD
MLPLLRDRPVSMTRFPDGIASHGIVQKNVPAYFPDWITRARIRKEGGWLQQVIIDQPATLVYLAGQACIELHAFLSRVDRIREPDQLIFDLDPPDDHRFDDVRACALRLCDLLTGELRLPTFVKTTGGRGLHVHVPLNPTEDFDAVREFARQIADLLAARNPGLVTTEQRKDKRGPRIYADIMRNAYAQLAIAPYAGARPPRGPGGGSAVLGRGGGQGPEPRAVHASDDARPAARGRPGGRPVGGDGPAANRPGQGARVAPAAYGLTDAEKGHA